MKDIEKVLIPILIVSIITALGCYCILNEYKKPQKPGVNNEEEVSEEEELVSKEDMEYECIAMLLAKDMEEKILTLRNIETGKEFRVEVGRTTEILGKHGNSMSLEQIKLGEILDIDYSVHSRNLNKVQISSDTWTMTDITKFHIDEKNHSMEIGDSLYKLSKSCVVSYGEKLAKLIDVTNVDTITVKGNNREVLSIIIDRGHGYLRLVNEIHFVDGWIEIGQDIIKPITEGMLIPVPEGNYHVRVTHKGYAGEEDVTIERDKETKFDFDSIPIKEVAIGHIAFKIIPDYAHLYIDGEMSDYEERVPLEFGIHKIHVELAGYQDVDTNIKISSEYADVEITLDSEDSSSSSSSKSSSTKKKSSSLSSSSAKPTKTPTPTPTPTVKPTRTPTPKPTPTPTGTGSSSSSTDAGSSSSSEGDTSNDNTTSSSSMTGTSEGSTDSSSSSADIVVGDKPMVYVQEPEGAKVYVDGEYKGECPISFIKDPGEHIFTLEKEGFNPQSRSISIDDDGKDLIISFSDLFAE